MSDAAPPAADPTALVPAGETTSETNENRATRLQKSRAYYHANAAKRRRQKIESRRRHEWRPLAIDTILTERGCQVCHWTGAPEALDAHHLDPTTKLFNVGHAADSRSWTSIVNELQKCACLCAKCHRLQRFDYISTPLVPMVLTDDEKSEVYWKDLFSK